MISKLPLRYRVITALGLGMVILGFVFIKGWGMKETAWAVNFSAVTEPPSGAHVFGTDWLGRDLFSRTIRGLTTSIGIGAIASLISAVMAVLLGVAAGALGRKADALVNGMINLFLSLPHIILLMLIAIACGKGMKGVLIGVALTHWTGLARIIRAEVLGLKHSTYIAAAKALGKSNFWIARKHILPHILPQSMTGAVLLFPHAILHEAAITFLGFGLSPEQPAIGVILAESMRYISAGYWWLAVFPGLSLLSMVILFDVIGEHIRILFNPGTAHV